MQSKDKTKYGFYNKTKRAFIAGFVILEGDKKRYK